METSFKPGPLFANEETPPSSTTSKDGQSEKENSTVLDLLKCYVSEHKGKWEQYLPLVKYAYNNTVHSSTGKAPFEIVEGGKKVPPILHTKDKIFEADKYVQDMDEMYKKVKVALEKTQAKQKKAADSHRREVVFSLGDWVLLRFEKARLKKMKGKEKLFPKLSMRYYGPFQVCDKISDVAYMLKLPESWRIHNAFHRNDSWKKELKMAGQAEEIALLKVQVAEMSAVLAKPQVKDFLKTLAKGKEKGQEQRKEHDVNAHAATAEEEPSKKPWEEDIPELSSPGYSPPTSFSYSSDSSSSSNPRRRVIEGDYNVFKRGVANTDADVACRTAMLTWQSPRCCHVADSTLG
ncbi:hypothetical protein L7F22_060034 [Adiantum nelumboides]|nr:hypothetical protein [Adiantum nelumboides]